MAFLHRTPQGWNSGPGSDWSQAASCPTPSHALSPSHGNSQRQVRGALGTLPSSSNAEVKESSRSLQMQEPGPKHRKRGPYPHNEQLRGSFLLGWAKASRTLSVSVS